MFFLKRFIFLFASLALIYSLSGCYQQDRQTPDAWNLTEQQIDSISFYTTHHYSQNYNFLVKADSLGIILQHPTEFVNGFSVDTVMLYRNERIVVADITTMPADTIDSIWVKVARDQQTIGWLHEKEMLPSVQPDAPISQFINFFSDTHLLILLAILVLAVSVFLIRRLMRLGARIVHFSDIPSFYPTLLCLSVATSAVFYSTIQLFAPDSWRHYYYHPTLNPFAVPFHLSIFLLSVWAMLLIAVATIDDVRRQLPAGESLFYFLGLSAICAIDYVVFSVSTIYYIGYPLLVVYIVFAIQRYLHNSRPYYQCGCCGAKLRQKGACPHCGAVNV